MVQSEIPLIIRRSLADVTLDGNIILHFPLNLIFCLLREFFAVGENKKGNHLTLRAFYPESARLFP